MVSFQQDLIKPRTEDIHVFIFVIVTTVMLEFAVTVALCGDGG